MSKCNFKKINVNDLVESFILRIHPIYVEKDIYYNSYVSNLNIFNTYQISGLVDKKGLLKGNCTVKYYQYFYDENEKIRFEIEVEGNFIDGFLEGYSKFTLINSICQDEIIRFEGNFINGIGEGKMNYVDPTKTIIGIWKNGKFQSNEIAIIKYFNLGATTYITHFKNMNANGLGRYSLKIFPNDIPNKEEWRRICFDGYIHENFLCGKYATIIIKDKEKTSSNEIDEIIYKGGVYLGEKYGWGEATYYNNKCKCCDTNHVKQGIWLHNDCVYECEYESIHKCTFCSNDSTKFIVSKSSAICQDHFNQIFSNPKSIDPNNVIDLDFENIYCKLGVPNYKKILRDEELNYKLNRIKELKAKIQNIKNTDVKLNCEQNRYKLKKLMFEQPKENRHNDYYTNEIKKIKPKPKPRLRPKLKSNSDFDETCQKTESKSKVNKKSKGKGKVSKGKSKGKGKSKSKSKSKEISKTDLKTKSKENCTKCSDILAVELDADADADAEYDPFTELINEMKKELKLENGQNYTFSN